MLATQYDALRIPEFAAAARYPQFFADDQPFFDDETLFENRDDRGVALVANGRRLCDDAGRVEGPALDMHVVGVERRVDGRLMRGDRLRDPHPFGFDRLRIDKYLLFDDRNGGAVASVALRLPAVDGTDRLLVRAQ